MGTAPIRAEELAVCVAINNNDNAWYEMLVPFLLSLRRTGYPGFVAVIGFGLSQQKIRILCEYGVSVFEATETLLSIGRYLEVAKLCEKNPGLKKIALYDADIWFCGDRFDLFDAIDGDNLHACRDAMYCNFILDRLIGPNQAENARLAYDVSLEKIGGAVQAGLVAGTRKAWREFAAHVQDCKERVGVDFDPGYGFDTTILQLWAAQGRIDILSQLQNFISKSGLGEKRPAENALTFVGAEGPVRAIHMTSDIRFVNCWRYYSVHRAEALSQGRRFALKETEPQPLGDRASALAPLLAEMGLEVASGTLEPGGGFHPFRHGDQLHVVGIGNHELVLRAARPFTSVVLDTMYFSAAPGPIRASVRFEKREVVINRDANQWIGMGMAKGTSLTIRSEGLPGQMCKVVWVFSEDLFLWQ